MKKIIKIFLSTVVGIAVILSVVLSIKISIENKEIKELTSVSLKADNTKFERFGWYSGATVFYIENQSLSEKSKQSIEGPFSFFFYNHSTIMVYKNKEIYTLEEAYKESIITYFDVGEIYVKYAKFIRKINNGEN